MAAFVILTVIKQAKKDEKLKTRMRDYFDKEIVAQIRLNHKQRVSYSIVPIACSSIALIFSSSHQIARALVAKEKDTWSLRLFANMHDERT
jgi:hypothetical protein